MPRGFGRGGGWGGWGAYGWGGYPFGGGGGRGNPFGFCRSFPWLPRWWWASPYASSYAATIPSMGYGYGSYGMGYGSPYGYSGAGMGYGSPYGYPGAGMGYGSPYGYSGYAPGYPGPASQPIETPPK